MKIKYIFNSGFIIEDEENIFIIDAIKKFKLENPMNKKVFFLVTHSHGDHFNPFIFNYKADNVYYILSDDIRMNDTDKHLFMLKPYMMLNIHGVTIKTLGSTDRGVSFLIKSGSKTYFHSGDLNWWHWKNDDIEVQKREETDYKNEIKKLKKYLKDDIIDIAFIPVDRRLEEFCTLAIDFFLSEIPTLTAFPMHFGVNYEYIEDLDPVIKKYDNINIKIIYNKNDKFEI